MTSVAPKSASTVAIPYPMPRPPPVTTATEPESAGLESDGIVDFLPLRDFPELLPSAYNRQVWDFVLQNHWNAGNAQVRKLLAFDTIPTYNPPLRTLVLFHPCVLLDADKGMPLSPSSESFVGGICVRRNQRVAGRT